MNGMSHHTCHRCRSTITGSNYHDGAVRLSSPNNQRDITGTADGFIELCDACYQAYHRTMKAWLSGAKVRIIGSVHV